VTGTGYIVIAILVLLVLRQIRGSRLDLINLVLPAGLVAGAAAGSLRSVPSAGSDVALDVVVAGTGAALGFRCAWATRLRREPDGTPFAGPAAATMAPV
jgi:hypothetical protein